MISGNHYKSIYVGKINATFYRLQNNHKRRSRCHKSLRVFLIDQKCNGRIFFFHLWVEIPNQNPRRDQVYGHDMSENGDGKRRWGPEKFRNNSAEPHPLNPDGSPRLTKEARSWLCIHHQLELQVILLVDTAGIISLCNFNFSQVRNLRYFRGLAISQ